MSKSSYNIRQHQFKKSQDIIIIIQTYEITKNATKKLNRQLGAKATYRGIQKAGHLVHLERPCFYNRCLKEFLASLNADQDEAKHC